MEKDSSGCPRQAWFMREGCESGVCSATHNQSANVVEVQQSKGFGEFCGVENECRNVAQVQQSDSWVQSIVSRSRLFRWIQRTFGSDYYGYLIYNYDRHTPDTDKTKIDVWKSYFGVAWSGSWNGSAKMYDLFKKYVPNQIQSKFFADLVSQKKNVQDAIFSMQTHWMQWQPVYKKKIQEKISHAQQNGTQYMHSIKGKFDSQWHDFEQNQTERITIRPGELPVKGTYKDFWVDQYHIEIKQSLKLECTYDEIETKEPTMQQEVFIKSNVFKRANSALGDGPGTAMSSLALDKIEIFHNKDDNAHQFPYILKVSIQYQRQKRFNTSTIYDYDSEYIDENRLQNFKRWLNAELQKS